MVPGMSTMTPPRSYFLFFSDDCRKIGMRFTEISACDRCDHSLTAPAARPDCQYFCRHRNAMTNGTIVINEPVTTRFWIAWPPAVLAWSFHWFRPIQVI